MKKTWELLCVICLGLPMMVLGYLAPFIVAGFMTGVNLNRKFHTPPQDKMRA